MTSTEPHYPLHPTSSEPPSVHEMLEEIDPLIGVIFVAGPPVVIAAVAATVLTLMLIGPFLLLVTAVVVIVAAIAVIALAGAILATPYLLVRRAHRRRMDHAITRPAAQLTAVPSRRVTA